MKYGLIGERLEYSHSKKIHERIADYKYDLLPMPAGDVEEFVLRGGYDRFNVTIPYKQVVMPLLDFISDEARRIGSVNTVLRKDGRLLGYNTDYAGFLHMANRAGISFSGRKTLILGTGGASQTAQTVAKDQGASEVVVVSRSGLINYENIYEQCDTQVIVNTTPIGTYPKNGERLIEISRFPKLEGVLDMVYNPLRTAMVLDARRLKIKTSGGLSMLVHQAVVAAGYFTGRQFDTGETERILHSLAAELGNIILIGMPSCGKSRLGQALARRMKRPFMDLDIALTKRAGISIPEIFERDGEEVFRRLETEVLAKETALPGRVISTGGGVVTRAENLRWLHQNGTVIFIHRPLEKLEEGKGRPLSHSKKAVELLYRERLPLYEAAADITVKNDGAFMQTVYRLQAAYEKQAGDCGERRGSTK